MTMQKGFISLRRMPSGVLAQTTPLSDGQQCERAVLAIWKSLDEHVLANKEVRDELVFDPRGADSASFRRTPATVDQGAEVAGPARCLGSLLAHASASDPCPRIAGRGGCKRRAWRQRASFLRLGEVLQKAVAGAACGLAIRRPFESEARSSQRSSRSRTLAASSWNE